MSRETLVDLEVFLPDIEPELPRCPMPVIENRIRDAIIDACERANIWRWHHPEILLKAGVTDYSLLTPTSDSLIHSILSVTQNGRPIGYDARCSAHDDMLNYGNALRVVDRGSINLNHAPLHDSTPMRSQLPPDVPDEPGAERDAALVALAAWENYTRSNKGVEVMVSVKPSRTTLQVPQRLVRDYYQLIRYGALAKGLMMLDRPWSNYDVGKDLDYQYELALAKARQGIDRGFKTGTQRLRPKRFSA